MESATRQGKQSDFVLFTPKTTFVSDLQTNASDTLACVKLEDSLIIFIKQMISLRVTLNTGSVHQTCADVANQAEHKQW